MRKLSIALAMSAPLWAIAPALGQSNLAHQASATMYDGKWKSDYGPYGGGLTLSNVVTNASGLSGTIHFASSGCPNPKPFTGRYEDAGKTLYVNTHLGSPCGRVGLKMTWDESQKAWVGKYTAEFPDGGNATLAPR